MSAPHPREAPGRPSRHGPIAQLLIAWSPLSGILVAYAVAGWISAPLSSPGRGADTNRLGLGLHIGGPPALDERLFGAVPSVWLQQHLVDGAAHWYDGLAALIYITHFIALPIATALVWFRLRARFRAWITAVLAFAVVGMTGYVLYPAAPPWMAAEQDRIGTVDRLSGLGWHYLGLDRVAGLTDLLQGQSNPVAAMPSLHAGAALLIALFLWPSVRRAGRVALLGYAGLMALTLVYTGEHYVVDVLAGWATAGVAVATGALVRGRAPRIEHESPVAEPVLIEPGGSPARPSRPRR
jgi:membrane-associated phospholipid phosphatase